MWIEGPYRDILVLVWKLKSAHGPYRDRLTRTGSVSRLNQFRGSIRSLCYNMAKSPNLVTNMHFSTELCVRNFHFLNITKPLSCFCGLNTVRKLQSSNTVYFGTHKALCLTLVLISFHKCFKVVSNLNGANKAMC